MREKEAEGKSTRERDCVSKEAIKIERQEQEKVARGGRSEPEWKTG